MICAGSLRLLRGRGIGIQPMICAGSLRLLPGRGIGIQPMICAGSLRFLRGLRSGSFATANIFFRNVNQADLETGEYPQDDLCVVLWLRDTDNDFYNDFCLMAQRLTPPHLQFFCAAATAEDTELVEFLQKYQPLWPVTAE